MNKPLRVACIGAGNSGTGHLIMLERLGLARAVAFCDRDRAIFDSIVDGYLGKGDAKAGGHFKTDAELRPDFRDIPFYTDPEEMLAKEDIDAVVVATWCNAHAEMSLLCAKHDKHIFLEKPVAITEEDVDRLWRELRDYPKVVTVNFTMRGAPVSLAAKRHVRDGTIGDMVSVQYVNNVHYGDNYFRKWMRKRENVGDLFLQKATHDLDIINSIVGRRPLSVAAFGSRRVYGGDMPNDLTCHDCDLKRTCGQSLYKLDLEANKGMRPPRQSLCVYAKEIDIDDNQVMIIQYEDGVTASYSQSFNAPHQGGQRGGYFIGTEGIMRLHYYNEFVEAPRGPIVFGNSAINITRLHQKPGTAIDEVYDWGGHAHFDGTEYGLVAKVDRVEGRPTEVTNSLEEGYISAKMCLAAQRSIETGQVVQLDLDL